MKIESEELAFQLLDNVQKSARDREAAVKYLAERATPAAIHRVVLALDDDDFGVHWEAAVSLANLGEQALPDLLKALTTPKLAGSPRLREGAYHVLHYNASPTIRNHAKSLMDALKGVAPAISTMIEANHWLEQLESQGRVTFPQA